MGIFDIFKSNKQESSSNINSPFDLFSVEFNSVPDDSFEIVEEGKTGEGTTFKTYHKHLSTKENGLFETLEIVVFEDGGKNFIFKGQSFSSSDISSVKQLLNKLFMLYGTDDLNSGKFLENDQLDIQDGFWIGRMWNSDPYDPYLMFSGDIEEGWSLTMWTKK